MKKERALEAVVAEEMFSLPVERFFFSRCSEILQLRNDWMRMCAIHSEAFFYNVSSLSMLSHHYTASFAIE